jgi:hypothetical protein
MHKFDNQMNTGYGKRMCHLLYPLYNINDSIKASRRNSMIYRCPLCCDWFEYYSHAHSGYWLQREKQVGAREQTIIDEWNTISTLPAPVLQSIAVDPKTSALLILDVETSICNNQRL